MRLDIIGPSYVSRASYNNNRELINWYLEKDTQGGREGLILMPSPGTSIFSTVSGQNVVRGLYNYNGTCYGVVGSKFVQISSAGAVTIRGTLSTSTGRVDIDSIQDQIMITDGTAGYTYTVSTTTFAVITDADYPDAATNVTSMNGRFVVTNPNTDQAFYSNLRAGTGWQALNFYRAESLQDDLVSLHFTGRVMVLFGKFTSEIWQADTSGSTNFLVNTPGTFIDYGIIAPHSICQMENCLFGLTQNRYGQGEVLQTIDFDTKIISTPAIHHYISSLTTLTDAFGYIYQEKGRKAYRLTFPTDGVTLEYDILNEYWNKVSSFVSGENTRHISNCYTFCYGKHLVGDYQSGNIYEMSSNTYTDNGIEIRRTFIFPFVPNTEGKRTSIYDFELYCQEDVALETGQGSDPQVMFSYSRDGGHTWGNERTRSIGNTKWATVGAGRLPYGKITTSDPVPFIILGATANVQPENRYYS